MDFAGLYAGGSSLPEVSKATNIPLSTLRFRLKKLGLLRSRADGVRLAAKKGKLGHMKGKKRVFTAEWRENISTGKKRAADTTAAGVSMKKSGYIVCTRGDNVGRGMHVIAMEDKIGRRIRMDECVHHKNENRSDNSIENLQLMTRKEHAAHHAKKTTQKET